MSYTAIVAGATGSIGREVVRLLLDSASCTQVTALVRSAASAEAKLTRTAMGTPVDAAAKAAKLKVVEYDFEALCGEGSDGTSQLCEAEKSGANAYKDTRLI